MTKEERANELRRVNERLGHAFDEVVRLKGMLEELHCKKEAKKLDTVCGKLYDLQYYVAKKSKKN